MKRVPFLGIVLLVTLPVLQQLGCSSDNSSDGATGGTPPAAAGTSAGAGASTSGGAPGSGGASSSGGMTNTAGLTSPAGGGGSGGSTGTGGATSSGGVAGGGTSAGVGGAGGTTSQTGGSSGGGAGGSGPVDCSTAAAVITYPTLPGAKESPLYTVTANGAKQFVEKLTKFGQEMQVHYANFGVATGCTAKVSVAVGETVSSFTLSPKSRKIAATKTGNTIEFTSGPNYLILQIASKELLFVLIDEQETNPPHVGDANVKNIADDNVDATGATLVTAKLQAAIDAASGATKNIVYVPPGRYKVGELSLKSDMTLYLAAGAILDGSTTTGDYAVSGGPAVENTSHAVVHLIKATNTKILGRGVIDGNGSVIRGTDNETPSFKTNVLRIDQSSKILVDGIMVRDPVFWNTLAFDSDQVTLQNYKVINRRPTTTTYNQTDGVDFDCSTNSKLSGAFIYSGDDSMSPKREEEGTLDTSAITYEKVVAYSNSAATKIGTKTFGKTIDGVLFKDIDIVKAGRAMVIDANDTALIQNTTWENIRIEIADSNLIDIEEDRAPDWRTAPNTSTVKDAYFKTIAADTKQLINIHGKSSSVNVNGVHFSAFTVGGNPLTSQSDSDATWNINQYVSNITFQ